MHSYRVVARQPGLRRLLPAVAVSSLGDGMSEVGVAWLVLQLAPAGTGALWVAVCAAALVLPGTLLALVRRRAFAPAAAARVGLADAALHAVGLGAVPLAAVAGVLDVRLLAVLLAVSSLLSIYGGAARYTVVAAALPERDRLAGNAALSALAQTGVLAGPVVAGLLLALSERAGHGVAGATIVLALDAASFALLAVGYAAAAKHLRAAPAEGEADEPVAGGAPDQRAGGSAAAVRTPRGVTAVVVLTVLFYGLYEPVAVALPVHVAVDLQAPASLLAAFVTAFGIGALLGGLAGGFLGRVPERVLLPLIPVGWGLCLLPLGLGAPTPVAVAAFGVGAFVLGPYFAVTTTLVQRLTPPALLPHVFTRRGVLLGLASPLGLLAGGPLVQTVGAPGAVLVSALLTIALGVTAAVVSASAARPAGGPGARARQEAPTGPPRS